MPALIFSRPQQLAMDLLGLPEDLLAHAVDAEAHAHLGLVRLDVDVARTLPGSLR